MTRLWLRLSRPWRCATVARRVLAHLEQDGYVTPVGTHHVLLKDALG